MCRTKKLPVLWTKIGNVDSMKRLLKEATVNKNADKCGMQPQTWLLARQMEFEEATGVKWSFWPSGDGWHFNPIDEGVEPISDYLISSEIIGAFAGARVNKTLLSGYATYWDVAKYLKLPLRLVMGVVKWMEKRDSEFKAIRTVDRMGKGYAFRVTGLSDYEKK